MLVLQNMCSFACLKQFVMPTIYEYLGIIIQFYSREHEPIHIHAVYNGNVVKVTLHVRDGVVYRTTYANHAGSFPPAKLKQLKDFVSKYKQALLYAWQQYFDNGVAIKPIKITKKI